MRPVSRKGIPRVHKIGFAIGVGSPGPHTNFEPAEVLQNFKISGFSFFVYLRLISAGIFFFLALGAEHFNHHGASNANQAADYRALQSFSQFTLSLNLPGGEKLCQEALRPVLIIREKKHFFNVNLLNILGGGIAIS